MSRLFSFIVASALVAVTAAPAIAQQRLFALMDGQAVELDTRQATVGTVLRRFPMPGSLAGAVPFGGGQFLAAAGGYGVILFDTHSGSLQSFTFPSFYPTRVLGSDGNARLLVYGTNDAQHIVVLVADARTGSTHFVDLGLIGTVGQVAYAAVGDVLFVARPRTMTPLGGFDFYDVEVIQAATGTVLKTIDTFPLRVDRLTPNTAGARLLVSSTPVGAANFDVVSGTRVPSAAPELGYGFPLLDERRNRVIVSGSARLDAFAADSLQPLGSVGLPQLPLPKPAPPNTASQTQALDISDLSATMFVLQGITIGYNYYPHTCGESQLLALDASSGQTRRTVGMTSALGAESCRADLVRITEPHAPPAFAADVAGRQVTLRWATALDASQYEIEVGLTPGSVSLVLPSSGTELTVAGAPSGVYYARVRARNTIGRSDSSPEIRIVVP